MTSDVWDYFKNRYEKANFTVVPGHWPDFKSKEAVDTWIELMEDTCSSMIEGR